MAIYIIIWTGLFVSCLFDKNNKLLFYIWLIVLIFVEGGRSIDVGVDTGTYYNHFVEIGNGNYLTWVEPLWNFLCWFFYKHISSNYSFFLFVISAIILTNIFYVVKKESPNPFLSIFIFVSLHMYTASFNIMRQYLSMSIVMMSWYMYKINKIKLSYILIAIAGGFHFSTIFAILSFIWYKFKITYKRTIILLFASFIFGSIMNDRIMSLFTISIFDNFLEEGDVFREKSVITILLCLLQNLIAIFITKNTSKEYFDTSWFKLFILSCLVFNATYMIAYAARMYSIFAISQIVFFPIFLKQVKRGLSTVSRIILMSYFSAQFFRILLANGNNILPYENVLI